MRVERTPIEPTEADAAAARQAILDALAVLYPGWDFTAAAVLAQAGQHLALAVVGEAYNNPGLSASILFAGGRLAQQLVV